MKLNRQILAIALLSVGLTFTSCSNNETEEITTDVVETETTTTYKYDHSTSKVGFTAYKFLNKTGVGGEFTDFKVNGGEEDEDALEVIKSLSIEIPILSLNTKDGGRDEKISKFFFGTINVATITGEVVDIFDDGTAVLEITMNDITNEVEGVYTLDENGNFEFNADIDVNDWDGEDGVEALNEECHDLHIDFENGDTESKLWSEVSVSFSTQLEIIKE